MDARGLGKEDARFFAAFTREIVDRYGRLLAFLNIDDPSATRPADYNTRMLEQGLATPYFIWPNIDPWRSSGSLTDAALSPEQFRQQATASGALAEARRAIAQARADESGIFETGNPLRIHPFELRFLAQRRTPDRWVIDLGSDEPILRMPQQYFTIANAALAQFAPKHPALRRLAQTRARARGGRPSNTSLLVHGTFAKNNDWWQPGRPGNFHEYLLTEVSPDLYSASDRFDWSGGCSDAARDAAANELIQWLASHGISSPRLYTHSHGGSVAMLATNRGLQVEKLVLLSCPVHLAKYMPDFSHAPDVVSIRVRADLVILIDGGEQRFRDPRIRENVLSIWFDHSATHEPDVWRDHDVPSKL